MVIVTIEVFQWRDGGRCPFFAGRADFLAWYRGRFPWSRLLSDQRDSPVAREQGDRCLEFPQLLFEGRRHPCLYAEADLCGPVCSENHRDSRVRWHGGRFPCCVGPADSLLLWRRHSCSHSCSSLRKSSCRLVMVQRRFPIVQAGMRTTELPQLQFIDKVIDVPVCRLGSSA